MTKQIVLRQQSSNHRRRQPLLGDQPQPGSKRVGEVVGGTTAECAAVCCCCPCGLVNLLVLAMYKLPAGLCRKALKKRRSHRLKSGVGLFPQRRTCTCGCEETELHIHPLSVDMLTEGGKLERSDNEVAEKEAMELEKEMWERFYSTGFWRSPSQRE